MPRVGTRAELCREAAVDVLAGQWVRDAFEKASLPEVIEPGRLVGADNGRGGHACRHEGSDHLIGRAGRTPCGKLSVEVRGGRPPTAVGREGGIVCPAGVAE